MLQRTISDVLISQARNRWYRAVEPRRLKRGRREWKNPRVPGNSWATQLDIERGCYYSTDGSISVLIPTIGRWGMLDTRSLPSVLRQQHNSHINVHVLCDGCSPPDWLVKKYSYYGHAPIYISWHVRDKKRHYPDVAKLHWLVGPSNVLNHGLKQCWTTDWIARMDDDDIWRPTMLETMRKFALEGDYEFVSAAAKGPDGPIIPYKHPTVGSVQTWLYRSYLKCFKYNLGSWRKKWDCNNEIDLYKRMHDAGVRMGYKPCVVCDIKPRPGLEDIGSIAWIKEHECK